MKKTLLVFFVLPLFISCGALPFSYSRTQAWFIPDPVSGGKARNKERAAIELAGVHVDRAGGWDSIQKEFAALAPLYFWEQGCRVVSAGEQADYAADIQVREREYSSGWRIRRSLAVEVRLWDRKSGGGPEAAALPEAKVPLAAGRAILIGERSFASSDTAGRMLSKAVKAAVKKLSASKKRS
jgi:hypothetical protein